MDAGAEKAGTLSRDRATTAFFAFACRTIWRRLLNLSSEKLQPFDLHRLKVPV